MVYIIEEDFPVEFLGAYVIAKHGGTMKQCVNVTGNPEPLMTRIFEHGPESVPSPAREKSCKALYELSGVGGKDFWKRYPERISNRRERDDYFEGQYRKLRGANNSRRKKSEHSRQHRAVLTVHKKQNKKIGEPIKLTPAKVALIEHAKPEKDLINVVCTPYVRAAILNGKRYHMPKNRGKKNIPEYKRDVRAWFSDTLGVTWDELDPFKLRTYKWNSKKKQFDALERVPSAAFSKPTSKPKITKKLKSQLKDIEQQSIPTPIVKEESIAKERVGLFQRIINWWGRNTLASKKTTLYPKNELKQTEIAGLYDLNHHLNGKPLRVTTLFQDLRKAILSLNNHGNVLEKVNKRIISYKTAQNFCEVVVKTTGLLVFVDISKEEGLDDPRSITEDCSTKGRWGSGKTRFRLLPEDSIDYALSIIQQAYKLRL